MGLASQQIGNRLADTSGASRDDVGAIALHRKSPGSRCHDWSGQHNPGRGLGSYGSTFGRDCASQVQLSEQPQEPRAYPAPSDDFTVTTYEFQTTSCTVRGTPRTVRASIRSGSGRDGQPVVQTRLRRWSRGRVMAEPEVPRPRRPMSEPAAKADIELAGEQAHLAASRAQLARMRERTASLDSAAGGDWVSREYLESTFALRMKQLADDPSIALFFGRVDYEIGEVFHIGRRHVSDPAGEPMVIDWRAPVSRPFYRASRTEPMGVTLRRRYGFQQGRLTAYEDEHLTAGEAEEHSAILETEIERPRVGPMRDIVATIQPEQDVIVRSELSQTICVQGAPGTGKTAVGLHRAAYLLYAHREQLSRRGVLVVGPNASFLRFIRDVLPALGEIDAKQTTIVELVADTLARLQPRNGIRGEDTAAVATLKGDARMAAVLERALWSHVATPTEGLVVPRGARRWRVATYEIERGHRRPPAPGRAVRRRADDAAPVPCAPDPGQDGARRRRPRRPGPGRRRPQQTGQGLRQRDLASRRPTPAAVASAVRTGLSGRCRRRDHRSRPAGRSALAQAAALGGRRPLVARRRGAAG